LTAPAPDVRRTGIDDEGRPFEVTRFVMRAGHKGLDYTMPVEDQ
jgi:GntR family transcriptional regulator